MSSEKTAADVLADHQEGARIQANAIHEMFVSLKNASNIINTQAEKIKTLELENSLLKAPKPKPGHR